jgi:hypothetical protein
VHARSDGERSLGAHEEPERADVRDVRVEEGVLARAVDGPADLEAFFRATRGRHGRRRRKLAVASVRHATSAVRARSERGKRERNGSGRDHGSVRGSGEGEGAAEEKRTGALRTAAGDASLSPLIAARSPLPFTLR